MKPLKKKLCISVCLNELFEVVDDDNEKKDERRVTKSLVRSGAPVPEEEFLLRRTKRWRRYKNEWLKFGKESYYYRRTLQKLESNEDCWPFIETVQGEMKPSSNEMVWRKEDKYSLSHFKLDQEKGGQQKKTAEVRVDIALSTSFLTSSGRVICKQVETVPRIERGTSTKEKIDVTTQTDGEDRAVVRLIQMDKQFHEEGIAVYRYSAEYSSRNRIINNIISNNKTFLATKSTKRTNLSLRNHKSTQFDFGANMNLEAFAPDRGKHQKSKPTEVPNQEKQLEEIFNYRNLRKLSGNSLKRGVRIKKNHVVMGKASTRGSRMIHRRVPSEPKIIHHRMDAMVRKRSRVTCSRSLSSEAFTIIPGKRSLGNLTLKSQTMSNVECFLFYKMSVPWEIIPNDQIDPRMVPFETGNTLLEDSLIPFRRNFWPELDVNSFRMETECEISPTRVPSQSGGDSKLAAEKETDTKPPGASECNTYSIASTATLTDEKPEEPKSEVGVSMEVVEKSSEKLSLSKKKTSSEDSLYLRHMVLQALGPQIMEEVKQLSMQEELARAVQKSSTSNNNVASDETSSSDLMLQWELDIEIQSHDSGNLTAWRQIMKKSSSRGMSTEAEKESNTDVILVCPSKSQFHTVTGSSSQQSCGSEVEECFLKDEKLRKIYRANVPRHFLLATEQRFKENGRR